MIGVPEVIPYRGFRLNLQSHADGWKAFVYNSNGLPAELTVPSAMPFTNREACVAEAKLVIDNFFESLGVSENWSN